MVSKNAFSLAKLPYSLYHNCLQHESSIPLLAIQNKGNLENENENTFRK